jgi:hypothetical protein
MVVAFLGLGAAVGSSLVHGAAPGIVICGAVFLVRCSPAAKPLRLHGGEAA